MEDQFNYLFTPIKLGPKTVKNRIYFGPHGTMMADQNYIMDDRYVEYLKTRAIGGAGLIIAGMMTVMQNARDLAGIQEIHDERVIPMLKKLADALHNEGAVGLVQLCHTGRESDPELSRLPAWSASAVPSGAMFRDVPKEMEIEDIREVVKAFKRAARFVKEAGLDGVEIHGGSGYLPQQFMSPVTNFRTDEYGGSLDNRLRFPMELIDAIHDALGDDLVLGFRLSGDDFVPGGNSIDDYKEIAQKLEATGKIDFIHVGGPFYEGIYGLGMGMQVPLGFYTPHAVGFKEVVDLPVLNDFRINDPVQGEKILANGQGDMVGMIRALIADPELPNKAKEGRIEEIRSCIACDQGCIGRAFKGKALTCLQNAAVGLELKIGKLEPVTAKNKILIVGGGPAGMETARVAKLRGHDVVLYEKENELGGQVNIAAKVQSRAEFAGITRYLVKQMEILGVKVNTGVTVTPELVAKENPDAVVIATGSKPFIPPVPGADQDNVFSVWDVLLDKADIGENVVVVDGGEAHWPCCSVAEYLADKGRKVEIITPLLFVGMELAATADLMPFYVRVRSKGVEFKPNLHLMRISGSILTVLDVYAGVPKTIEGVDTIVLAAGNRADDRLYKELKGKTKELHRVGDCVSPRRALEAIYEGYNLGRIL
jgi:mycofactocin system FadH/OYE family oxidoreductase 2